MRLDRASRLENPVPCLGKEPVGQPPNHAGIIYDEHRVGARKVVWEKGVVVHRTGREFGYRSQHLGGGAHFRAVTQVTSPLGLRRPTNFASAHGPSGWRETR